MSRLKLFLLVALLGLSLTSVALFIRGGKVVIDPTPLTDALPENVDMQLTGVNFTEVTEGGQEWNMQADRLHYFKKDDLMVLENVRAVLHSKDGPMNVKGEMGYYDKNAKKMRLVGQVLANDALGRKLTTQEIQYDVTARVLTVPGRFHLSGPDLDLSGEGLLVHTEENRFKVLKRARLTLTPANSSL
jgi:LPS export ABC transporter protein LptC